MKFEKLIRFARSLNASDLIIKSGVAPVLRIYGELKQVEARPLTDMDIQEFLLGIIGQDSFDKFRREQELDIALPIGELGRFRMNVLQQRKHLTVVLRLIEDVVPTLGQLHHPKIVRNLAMRARGLVLVTGPAGCGKTTTIASMIQYRAERDPCHIITIEDPIEYLIPSQKALVDQREVGRDTHSFTEALKRALRQDPDVIVIGEMRDLETIQMAITAAETGHLVLSTLHTIDAVRTIDRIIDVFPPHQQKQVRLQLSANLAGVISQVLLKGLRTAGRVMAAEILMANPAIQNLIRESKTHMINSILQTLGQEAMKTMNRALFELIENKLVSYEECLIHSPNPQELEKMCGRRKTIMESLTGMDN